MPEGDTLYRVAANVRPVLEGKRIVAASASDQTTVEPIDAVSLVGHVVTEVSARGKHLMLSLDDDRVVHSHLGMTGSWHVYPHGEAWRKPASRAALALHTDTHVIIASARR